MSTPTTRPVPAPPWCPGTVQTREVSDTHELTLHSTEFTLMVTHPLQGSVRPKLAPLMVMFVPPTTGACWGDISKSERSLYATTTSCVQPAVGARPQRETRTECPLSEPGRTLQPMEESLVHSTCEQLVAPIVTNKLLWNVGGGTTPKFLPVMVTSAPAFGMA